MQVLKSIHREILQEDTEAAKKHEVDRIIQFHLEKKAPQKEVLDLIGDDLEQLDYSPEEIEDAILYAKKQISSKK